MSRSYVPRAITFGRYGDAKPGTLVYDFGEWVKVPGPSPEPAILDPLKPVAHEFTPGETIALLELRCSNISMAVVRKLKHSTARSSAADYASLRERGYAYRKVGQGFHAITPAGLFKAGELARELAKMLGLKPKDYTPSPRTMFHQGCWSQEGNA